MAISKEPELPLIPSVLRSTPEGITRLVDAPSAAAAALTIPFGERLVKVVQLTDDQYVVVTRLAGMRQQIVNE